MSVNTNITFHIGETWSITGTVNDATGNPIDLTGGIVQLRLYDTDPNVLALDWETPVNGTIIDPVGGQYQFVITPTYQAPLVLTSYRYEIRATTAADIITVQNTGEIKILNSAYVNFP